MPARDDYDDEDDYGYGPPDAPEPDTCPNCGSRRSTKISFTWWGGVVGPSIFSLVKCAECGQQYNRKTGKPFEWVHIILYTLVVSAIALVVFGLLFGVFG
jgi:hypothetical protein